MVFLLLLSLITEYADDGDLDQYIKKVKKEEGTIPQWQIWKMFIQIIKGLKVLHSSNIAHRDLKVKIFLYLECQYIFVQKW